MAESTEHDGLFAGGSNRNGHPIPTNRVDKFSPLLFLAGVATTIGGSVPVGYNIGVINAPANMIKVFCNDSVVEHYGSVLTVAEMDILWSALVSIFLVGGVTGSMSGGWLADSIGRKGAIVVSGFLSIVGAILFVTCRVAGSVEMLMAGRLVVGLAGGLTTSTVPMYLSELAPLSLRGTMGVLCGLGVTAGVVVAQVAGIEFILGRESTWHYLLAFFAVLVLLGCSALPWLPESPKYLYVVKKEKEKAKRELTRLRSDMTTVAQDMEDLEKESLYSNSRSDDNGIWSVIRDPSLRLPLLLMCALQAGQQLAGINAVFYYSVSIFEAAGLSKSGAEWGTLAAGGVNLAVACCSPVIIARVDRRPLIQFSCFTAAGALALLWIVVLYIHSWSWLPYFSIASVLLYVFFYQLALGPIPYFIGSELFEVSPRPSAMALGSMANWGGNFVVGMTFPSLQAAIGPNAFLPFAIIACLLGIFMRFYLPETRGLDPTQVAPLVSKGFRSRPLQTTPAVTITSK